MTTITTIHQSDPAYPLMFHDLDRMPTRLGKKPVQFYARGNIELLNSPCVAIIGTREPTQEGINTTRKITRWAVSRGYTIVAGLAPGIDSIAHTTALNSLGNTIAVLASTLGYDIRKVHPGNDHLSYDIVNNGGLLITEYSEPAYAPKRYFERDRLQSALSLLVIPVQAGYTSGTLHTCNHAYDQGRPIRCPYPSKQDYLEHHEKYSGLCRLVDEKKALFFSAKDYTELEGLIRGQREIRGL